MWLKLFIPHWWEDKSFGVESDCKKEEVDVLFSTHGLSQFSYPILSPPKLVKKRKFWNINLYIIYIVYIQGVTRDNDLAHWDLSNPQILNCGWVSSSHIGEKIKVLE